MPLGQYGYEPEPVEEPEPEREKRFDITRVGCGLLALAILIGIAAVVINSGALKGSPKPYTNNEMVRLRNWLHKQPLSPWLNPIRERIVSSTVAFDHESEFRVYRLRGLMMQQTIDLIEGDLIKAGFKQAFTDSRSNMMEPDAAGFRAMYEKDSSYVEFEKEKQSEDILLCETFSLQTHSADLDSAQKDTGFDPRRSISTLEMQDLAPSRWRDH